MATVVAVVAWLASGLAVVTGVVLLSFRTGFAPVLSAVRRVNRRVTNPRQLRTAGRPGAAAGVVEHVGRRSGTTYRTPVGIERDGDRLLVLLPYGAGADWVRNVLAAGAATVRHEGDVLAVTNPTVLDRRTVVDDLSPADRRAAALFGIGEVLRVEVATAGSGAAGTAPRPT